MNAVCRPSGDSYTCHCPESYTGNPQKRCDQLECAADDECLSSEKCRDNECVDACSEANCVQNSRCVARNHDSACLCLPGFVGNPLRFCEREKQDECQADSDCPGIEACINKKCENACETIKPCGKNAICEVIDKQKFVVMACTCSKGYEGDAFTACRPSESNLNFLSIFCHMKLLLFIIFKNRILTDLL